MLRYLAIPLLVAAVGCGASSQGATPEPRRAPPPPSLDVETGDPAPAADGGGGAGGAADAARATGQLAEDPPPVEPDPPAAEAKGPTQAERDAARARLFASPTAQTAPSTLLFGFHVESLETYFGLYTGEGQPTTDTGPGYRTWVLHDDGQTVARVADLPYVVVPSLSGFRYLDEVTVHIQEEGVDPDWEGWDPPEKYYLATAIVEAGSAPALDRASRAERARLKRKRKWGTQRSESLRFVTPAAICTETYVSEWTGGAVAFMGHSFVVLSGRGGTTVGPKLSQHLGDPELEDFARSFLAVHSGAAQPVAIDLDQGADNWGIGFSWRKDTSACLGHFGGQPHLLGGLSWHSNNWRSTTVLHPVGPAPSTLAPSAPRRPVAWEQVEIAFPDALDVFPAPAGDLIFVLLPGRLLGFRAPAGEQVFEMPVEPTAAVMVEWSQGETAKRWANELRR